MLLNQLSGTDSLKNRMRGQMPNLTSNLFKGFVVLCLLIWLFGDANQNPQFQNAALQQSANGASSDNEENVVEEEDEEEVLPVLQPKWCEVMPINIGNFSSHVFEYVTAVLVAQAYGKTACVSENKHAYMSWLFDSLPLKRVTLEEYQALYDDVSFKVQLGSKDITAFPIRDADLVILESPPMPVNLIEAHRSEVVEMLHLSQKYQDLCKSFFEPLSNKYGSEVTFVGTHFRVTNDGHSLTKPIELQKLVKEAIKWIVATAATSSKLVFIISSDDSEWCKMNLNFGTVSVEYLADHRELLKGSDPFYFDFAVLSLCDHSVINNAGAMSFWTSFLAGGDVFMPFDFPELKQKPDLIVQIERADNERYHNVIV